MPDRIYLTFTDLMPPPYCLISRDGPSIGTAARGGEANQNKNVNPMGRPPFLWWPDKPDLVATEPHFTHRLICQSHCTDLPDSKIDFLGETGNHRWMSIYTCNSIHVWVPQDVKQAQASDSILAELLSNYHCPEKRHTLYSGSSPNCRVRKANYTRITGSGLQGRAWKSVRFWSAWDK